MSLSRSSDATVLQRLKKWCKKKATSKPFQAVIGVTEGVSLGTSTLSALERAIGLGAPSGVVLRVLSGISYGTAGLVAVIMSYMTFKYVSINVKHVNMHGEQVKELLAISDEHEEQIKRLQSLMLLEKEQTLQILDILISTPIDENNLAAGITQTAYKKLKENLINDFKKLQEEAIERRRPRYDEAEQKEDEVDDGFIVLPTTTSSSSAQQTSKEDRHRLHSHLFHTHTHAHGHGHGHHHEPSVTSSPKSSYAPHRFFTSNIEQQAELEMIELHEIGENHAAKSGSASARPASP